MLREDIPAKQYIEQFADWENGDVDGVYQYAVGPMLHEFATPVFGDMCRHYVHKLQKENVLPFRYSKMGHWFGKTTVHDTTRKHNLRTAKTEIDIVVLSQNKHEYLEMVGKLMPQKESAKFFRLFLE